MFTLANLRGVVKALRKSDQEFMAQYAPDGNLRLYVYPPKIPLARKLGIPLLKPRGTLPNPTGAPVSVEPAPKNGKSTDCND